MVLESRRALVRLRRAVFAFPDSNPNGKHQTGFAIESFSNAEMNGSEKKSVAQHAAIVRRRLKASTASGSIVRLQLAANFLVSTVPVPEKRKELSLQKIPLP